MDDTFFVCNLKKGSLSQDQLQSLPLPCSEHKNVVMFQGLLKGRANKIVWSPATG